MKSLALREQISALKDAGHSIRKIAVSLGISRNTVRYYLRITEQKKEFKVNILEKKKPLSGPLVSGP